VPPNKPSFKQGPALMTIKILPAFFQGPIQIDDYHAPSIDTPFVESNSCMCDFPAQIDVIVFSLAIFSQPRSHSYSVITQLRVAGQLIFNFSK